MNLLRKNKYSQAEISLQVADISELQAQRNEAIKFSDQDEINNATNLIQNAQLYLERMLEQ